MPPEFRRGRHSRRAQGTETADPRRRVKRFVLLARDMVKVSPRAPVLGPAFIRLLARFGDAGLPRTPPMLAERLAEWFDWFD